VTPRWSLLKRYVGCIFQDLWENCARAATLLDSRSPHSVAHLAVVGIVVVRLSAVGTTDVVLLVVHSVLCLVLGLWVDVAVVVLGSRRGESLLAR